MPRQDIHHSSVPHMQANIPHQVDSPEIIGIRRDYTLLPDNYDADWKAN